MNREIQILLVVAAGVSAVFYQASSNQLRSAYNSTFLSDNKQLFKPIIIPNVTEYAERLQTATKATEPVKAKEAPRQYALQPQKPPTPPENYSDEESRINKNSLKFSSRYSTGKETDGVRTEERVGATEVPDYAEGNESEPGRGRSQGLEERKSFSDRSDDLDSSEEEEEEEDVRKYFEANEESEVVPTTNEPYRDLPSFRSTPHPEEDLKNYEVGSTLTEEKDSSEEEEVEESEEKRSVEDYHNSGSKNYHSVQTPLSDIQYRGPHSFQEGFDSERVRTRLVSPIRRPPISSNWPYSRSQIRAEAEEGNEISETDDDSLEAGIREELKGKPKARDLELAVEKDETKFGENTKYNYVAERNRGKQRLKSLAAEEEKDHGTPTFQTLKRYQVDEGPRYRPPKQVPPRGEETWPSKSPPTTLSRNIFRDTRPAKPTISEELAPHFQSHHFLGPVVFDHNPDHDKAKAAVKPQPKNGHKVFANAKALQEREKLDVDNLTDQRIQKSSIFGTGSVDHAVQSFNHLEESEEMYNAILANIQSVFGVRTQPSKSTTVNSAGLESKSLTWSVPLKKRS